MKQISDMTSREMIDFRDRKLVRVTIGLITIPLIVGLNSATADLGVTGTLQYIENPRLLENSKDDDWMRGLSIDANFARETQRFDFVFDYRASKYDYDANIQADRNEIEGAGQISWKILPEDVLTWNLSNTRSNQLLEASRPDVSDNQQIVEIISTGPTLNFAMGSQNLLSLDLDYSIADYEKSTSLDQDRKSINASLTRLISSVLTGTLQATFSDTQFDRLSVFDYELLSSSALLEYSNGSLALSLQGGEYSTKRTGVKTEKNPLLNASVNYRLNSTSEISASYQKSVEDLTSDLRNWQSTNPVNFENSLPFGERLGSSNIGGLYESKSKTFAYHFQEDARFNLLLEYTDNERRFVGVGSDEAEKSIYASLDIPLGQQFRVGLSTRFSEYTYSQLADRQDRDLYQVNFSYRASDSLRVLLSFWDLEQSSKTSIFNYQDFNAMFSVTYRY